MHSADEGQSSHGQPLLHRTQAGLCSSISQSESEQRREDPGEALDTTAWVELAHLVSQECV